MHVIPVTGLSAEYAEFDGTPYQPVLDQWGGRHDWYYSDAYRTIANIALDYEWFAKDEWESENVDRFLNFFCDTVQEKDRDGIFLTDGTILEGKALHPVAMTAVNARRHLPQTRKRHFSVSTVSGRHRFALGTEDIMTTVCISSHIWH